MILDDLLEALGVYLVAIGLLLVAIGLVGMVPL